MIHISLLTSRKVPRIRIGLLQRLRGEDQRLKRDGKLTGFLRGLNQSLAFVLPL